jgi:hypothetical protein
MLFAEVCPEEYPPTESSRVESSRVESDSQKRGETMWLSLLAIAARGSAYTPARV